MDSGSTIIRDNILINLDKFPPASVSVGEFVLDQIRHNASGIAMVHATTNESVTFGDIIQKTVKVAEGLKLRGIKEGDVVGICCENRLEYSPVTLGILAVGATCSPLNPMYSFDELIHILSISRPRFIFCSMLVLGKLKECLSHFPFIQELIVFDLPDSPKSTKLFPYSALISNSGRAETFFFPSLNLQDSVAFLFCSSGTTGLPKCVELTHANVMTLLHFTKVVWESESSHKVVLGLVPFFHGYGSCVLLASLVNQCLNVVMFRFEEEVFLRSIEKYKVTHLFLVPPLVLFLSKHPLVDKFDFSSVEKVLCGAAPLSKETQLAAQKRIKLRNDIRQGYGMTELTIVPVYAGAKKIGSSGTLAPGMECKFVDLTTGKALPPMEKGEICFRGPFVMKGYRNNPEATKASFDSEGWFHTGDIGYYDSDGHLYIVDRLKELIKYKGFQVPPAELETILINHPLIKEAGVIGIPDEEAGELPMAFVVLQPGAKLTGKEIQKYVAGKVSPQKRLHGGVKFVNEIPKNPSGKILRRELRLLVNKSKL